ncbi:MAG TPA: alpha-ketoglutarate-dependent dioxygenase AlkB [Pyrinomonadaceae bacterium]|nr:alpha-ketoglutarate-dependent dioxygenase AlkB [Pyrinomonadaceae bacterium]
MTTQFNFFDEPELESAVLEGFRYQPEFISASDEPALLTRVRELPFRPFEFHGYLGKRRTVSFGWQYEFSGGGKLQKAGDIPDFLLPLRSLAASFAALEPEDFEQALVIEYGPGSGIGWHRDKAVFGEVVGVSLLAPCTLRFRRKAGTNWQRVNISTAPRSAYLLTGPARSEWQHSILRVDALRYSITFRQVLESRHRKDA